MWQEFVSLFFPRVCISCDRALNSVEEHICLPCRLGLPLTNYHQIKDNPIAQKLSYTANVKQAFAFLKYYRKGIAQKILQELKYQGNSDIGILMGEWFGEELVNSGMKSDFDVIIPIPLHSLKQRRRGYNQSEMIAQGLENRLDARMRVDILSRKVYTETQTKKGKSERWTSTVEIFSVDQSVSLSEKNVLVLDDVITTGATVESAVITLQQLDPKSISVCALASGQ